MAHSSKKFRRDFMQFVSNHIGSIRENKEKKRNLHNPHDGSRFSILKYVISIHSCDLQAATNSYQD